MLAWLKAPFIKEDEITWLFEVYRWLLEHFGGFAAFGETSLVLPTPEFFPSLDALSGEDLAQALFDVAARHAGMEDWPVVLVEHDDGLNMREVLGRLPGEYAGAGGAAGTFGISDGEVEITYSPSQLENPVAFVATMAHELAHYLMATSSSPVPGGDALEEHATDVCSTFLGFGIFAANSAFQFSQFTDGEMVGWSTSRLGYLDERMHAASLAVFAELLDIDDSLVRPHLKTNPRSYFRKARRQIRKRHGAEIDRLRSMSGEGVGEGTA